MAAEEAGRVCTWHTQHQDRRPRLSELLRRLRVQIQVIWLVHLSVLCGTPRRSRSRVPTSRLQIQPRNPTSLALGRAHIRELHNVYNNSPGWLQRVQLFSTTPTPPPRTPLAAAGTCPTSSTGSWTSEYLMWSRSWSYWGARWGMSCGAGRMATLRCRRSGT